MGEMACGKGLPLWLFASPQNDRLVFVAIFTHGDTSTDSETALPFLGRGPLRVRTAAA